MNYLKTAKELFNMIGNYTDFIIISLIYMSHCELECKMTLSSSRSLKEALDMLNVLIFSAPKQKKDGRIGKKELFRLMQVNVR